MGNKKVLIITAGGSGMRMRSSVPKQFLTLGGKAVLHRTMEKFINAVPGIKIIAVLPEAHIESWKGYCYTHGFVYPQTLVAGGITRFHSVKNGLERAPEDSFIAIHDGVRPFVSEEMIKRLFKIAETCNGVIPVMPCTDTLKVLKKVNHPDESVSLEPIEGASADREMLFGAQTPQIFRSDVIKDAYRQAYDVKFTDDASVVAGKNIPLTYVEGERYNIKITTQEDLVLAKALMSI